MRARLEGCKRCMSVKVWISGSLRGATNFIVVSSLQGKLRVSGRPERIGGPLYIISLMISKMIQILLRNFCPGTYEVNEDKGRRKAGKFFTKFDYEPLDLLTINLGIYDQLEALEIVELVDQVGFDSISLGVTLGYIMEYNARPPDKPIFDGMTFGDVEKACHYMRDTAAGRVPEIGRGVRRLARSLGEA